MSTENTFIPVRIQHPDVNLGVPIFIYPLDINETSSKDVNYIPKPRTSQNYSLGPNTLSLDLLEFEGTFEITGLVKSVDHKKPSLKETDFSDTPEFTVSGKDVIYNQTNSLEVLAFNTYLPMGTVALKYGSETISAADGTELTRGTDYELDYARGRIKVLDTADTNNGGVPDTPFTVSATYMGESYYLAKIIRRMSIAGGVGTLIIGESSYFASGDTVTGQEYLVQFNDVEIGKDPTQPDETEVTISCRIAKNRV